MHHNLPRLDELIDAASNAPDDKRLAANLALGKFYLARGFYQEAKGAFDLALLKPQAQDNMQPALMARAVAEILVGRIEPAMKDLNNPVIAGSFDSELWKGLAAARQAESAERDALRESAERFIAGVGQWPKGGLESLKKALASQIHGDPTANEAALRKLCIRAEIFTDRPTPAEDQALRREHQVQRLVQGMGQGVGTDAAELDTLALEWVGVGPTEDGPYGTLEERFRRSRQHWLGQR